jgi:hypothetical protein
VSRRVILTPELAAAYRACHAEGLPRDVIAERLGVGYNTAVRFGDELGVPRPPPSPWTDPAKIERLIAMCRAGRSREEMARATGTTSGAVRTKVHRLRREGKV